MNSLKALGKHSATTLFFDEFKADKNKKRNRSDRLTQPDSVGVHHGGFWSRRPRFESESGYFLTFFATTEMSGWNSFTVTMPSWRSISFLAPFFSTHIFLNEVTLAFVKVDT